MPRVTRLLMAATGFALIFAMNGCVTSESSRYQRQLTSSVKADSHADIDVAAAFDLRRDQPHVAVTAIRDR